MEHIIGICALGIMVAAMFASDAGIGQGGVSWGCARLGAFLSRGVKSSPGAFSPYAKNKLKWLVDRV